MLSSIQIVSKEDADVERRKISKKEKKKKKKKNKEKEKKKRNKERKKVKEDDDDDDDDDDDESADSEDSDEGEVKRVSGNLQSSTKGVFENKTADALLSSREVEKEEDKDGFLAKALLSSDVTKKDTKSKTQIEREREEERVREVCASRELAGKSARDETLKAWVDGSDPNRKNSRCGPRTTRRIASPPR